MALKTILAVDTATGPCSVALARGGDILAHKSDERPVMQARVLLPLIEEALQQAGLGYGDITDVVSTVGPGSFTGLRIGLTAARAIAFTTEKPIHGVTTLSCIAQAARLSGKYPQTSVLALVNAGKGEVYAQLFSISPSLAAQDEPVILTPADAAARAALNNALVAGPVAHVVQEAAPDLVIYPCIPSAAAAALLAADAANNSALLIDAEPFYIRPPDAKLPA